MENIWQLKFTKFRRTLEIFVECLGVAIKNPALIQNPALLTWARETAGFDPAELAELLGIPVERLNDWEAGREALSLPKLRAFAEATKRPLAAFFLPSPPPANPVDKSAYRTVGSVKPAHSHKAIFSQRKVYALRETAIELAERLGQPIPSVPVFPPGTTSAQVAAFWREALDIAEGQRRSKNTREFFNWIRGKLELFGILIVQLSHVPTSVLRGFVLPEQRLPAIGLNWSDAYSAKNFTLLHELAHLVASLQNQQFSNYESLEAFCNEFAADLLVPLGDLVATSTVSRHGTGPAGWSNAEVLELAKAYKVSREVIALRLREAGLADNTLFGRVRGMIPYDKSEDLREDDSGGGLPRHIVAVSLLGRQLTSLVLSGYAENVITLHEATTHLGLSPKHIPKLTELLAKNAAV